MDDIKWPLESNRIFYQLLNDLNCQNHEIRITHTGSIDTWLNFERAAKTLEQQNQLVREKGMTIKRLFVGRDEYNKDSDYYRVMQNMDRYGIVCGYVRRDSPHNIIDMTWIPDMNLLSVWKPGVGGGVDSIEVTSDDVRTDLGTEWASLCRDAKFFDRTRVERSQSIAA